MEFKARDLMVHLAAGGPDHSKGPHCPECNGTRKEECNNCTTTPPQGDTRILAAAARPMNLAALRDQMRSALGDAG
jgi:hypothetical protein